MKNLAICIILMICLLSCSAAARLSMPSIFSDHMVIQAKMPVHVWGWANPGDKVTVKGSWNWLWGKTVTADAMGKWSCQLAPPKIGGPYQMHITADTGETFEYTNILCGQVWLCSGQSNMAMKVRHSENAQVESQNADYPQIRLFTVERTVASNPQSDVTGTWQVCSPDTVPDFSAVAYFFGRELHEKLDQPIGLIHSSWGGTPAESWTPMPVLEQNPDFADILDTHQRFLDRYSEGMKEYRHNMDIWQDQASKHRAKGKALPRRPIEPRGPGHKHTPSGLYNAMIAPLTKLSIKGVIWYQGEANSSRAEQYTKLFPAMIGSWRDKFSQPDLPFYFVQIAPFRSMNPAIRQAQLKTYRKLANTGIAVTTDIGDAEDIHPKNKQDVGKRLALWALAKTYGHKDIVFSGPMYREMKIEKQVLSYDTQANTQTHRAKIRLFFDYVADGLVAKDGPLRGFELAGIDGEFQSADAKIEGDTVVVWSDKIPQPVNVRFGWENVPDGNLYNSAGLPASPFTTDHWQMSGAN